MVRHTDTLAGPTDRIDRRTLLKLSGAAAALGLAGPVQIGTVAAQSPDERDVAMTFVPLDGGPGVLYEPVPGEGVGNEKARTGFVFMHPDSNFLTHSSGTELAKRGYRVLTANTRSNVKGGYHLHDLLPDVASAVRYLTDHPGVEQVILGGHSGGAHLMSFYQNVAENGRGACRVDTLYPMSDEFGNPELPTADGLVVLDGHLGYGPKGLIDLGAQTANDDPRARRAGVDMYDPENGFNPDGASSYDEEFLTDFYREQADRMERLIAVARSDLEQIGSGYADYPDDAPFELVDYKSRVYKTDPTILSRTQEAWPLLGPDGEQSTGVVPSVRGPKSTDSEPPLTYHGGAVLHTTVKRFLSTNAVRPTEGYRMTEDSIEGIDYSSTNASTPGNLEGVSVPLLVMGMTGHYFVVQSEIHVNHAGSSDKTLWYVEGASHGFSPIDEQYGDTTAIVYDAVDRWTDERFV